MPVVRPSEPSPSNMPMKDCPDHWGEFWYRRGGSHPNAQKDVAASAHPYHHPSPARLRPFCSPKLVYLVYLISVVSRPQTHTEQGGANVILTARRGDALQNVAEKCAARKAAGVQYGGNFAPSFSMFRTKIRSPRFLTKPRRAP